MLTLYLPTRPVISSVNLKLFQFSNLYVISFISMCLLFLLFEPTTFIGFYLVLYLLSQIYKLYTILFS